MQGLPEIPSSNSFPHYSAKTSFIILKCFEDEGETPFVHMVLLESVGYDDTPCF